MSLASGETKRKLPPPPDTVCVVDGCDQLGKFSLSKLGKPYRLKRCAEHFAQRCRQVAIEKRPPVGAKRIDSDGYVMLVTDAGWVAEHRVVMERKLGRPMRRGESVHHINGIRDDNRPENLELWVGAIRYGQRASDVKCPCCGCAYDVASMRRPMAHIGQRRRRQVPEGQIAMALDA